MPKRLADYPIYNVDWDDANAFCAWKGKRLPTEAEWERAARGGLDGLNYPWGEDKPSRERARYSTPQGPAPVKQHPPNGFGLYDMAGSVAEWCQDWFERTYYALEPARESAGARGGPVQDRARRRLVRRAQPDYRVLPELGAAKPAHPQPSDSDACKDIP